MRSRIYSVEVNLNEDGEIGRCSCSCPRGQFVCHHIAALCIYGHHNISVTDVQCWWSERKPKEEATKTIEEIYVSKTHKTTVRKVTDEEIDQFRTYLKQYGNTVGFTWLLNKEPSSTLLSDVPDIEELVFSETYLQTNDKKAYLLEALRLNNEIINHIKENTVGQWLNENWLTCRKHRLTASNFGPVLVAIGRNKFPPSLYKRLSGAYNLEHIKSVQWGNINERPAINLFMEQTNFVVIPTGLWLDECGFLGCSPDGLIGDDAIIEVKCPYKFRNKSLTSELKTDRTYIIHINENDEIEIKRDHEYYHQIQGNLVITGRKTCYLMIWTPNEHLIVFIEKDEEWSRINWEKLKCFYCDCYIPYVVQNVFAE